MLAIFVKELKSYFTSSIGYIFMGIFLLISGVFFALSNLLSGSPSYNTVLQNITFVFLLIVPVLTMKIISEETKSKTDQLLLTSPIKVNDIVIGKYLAAVCLFLISILITALYPLVLSRFGDVSFSETFTGYVGLFLLGACLISVGVFISALTENQVAAAVGTFGVLLCIWILDSISQGLPSTRKSGIAFAVVLLLILAFIAYAATKNIIVGGGTGILGIVLVVILYLVKKEVFDGLIQKVLGWLSLLQRYQMFSQGILSLNSVVYYLSFSTIFVFLTIRMIDKRRWS